MSFKDVMELKDEILKNNRELEIRLKTIETDHKNLKETLKKKEEDEQKRFNNQMVIVGILCTAITIGVNIYFNVIH